MPACRQCRASVPEEDVVTHPQTGARYHELVVIGGHSVGYGGGPEMEPYRCGPVRPPGITREDAGPLLRRGQR